MLKLPVPADLLLVAKEGELFFAQRVAELCYTYTRESYRVSTTTVPFLARECLSVIRDHREFDLHISGVERVLDELKRRSRQNSIVASLLSVPLESCFEPDMGNLGRVEDAVRVFAAEVNSISYLNEAVAQIIAADSNEKAKLDFLACELTTTLIHLGMSQDYIYDTARRIFFIEEQTEQSRLLSFLDAVKIKEVPSFDALIPIQSGIGELNTDILELFRSKTVETIPQSFEAPSDFVEAYQGNAYLHITGIRAPDHFSAVKLIKRNVVRIHDLLGLFYHKGSNEFSKSILVAKAGEAANTTLMKSDQNLMQMISDNPRTLAARKLETMVKSLRLAGGRDSEKFFRVVDFHGMSLNSSIPENQLINLWTSLETIAPSIKGKSIIGSVCEGIGPMLGLQYVSRTFLTAARDLKRWDNKKFKEAIKQVKSGAGLVEKTFLLITDPQFDAVCSALLAEMVDFPLLKYRIFDLNKKYKNGKNAEAQVRLHVLKAEQQIHRIYRTRNSIVHSAQKNDLTENLIISAHEYFDQVFMLTVELCSRPRNFNNYRDAFTFSRIAFENYLKGLSQAGSAPVMDASKFIWKAA